MIKWIFLSSIFLLFHPFSGWSQTWNYHIRTGDKTNNVCWSLNPEPDSGYVAVSENTQKGIFHKVLCDDSLITRMWKFTNVGKNTSYCVERKGDSFFLKGILNGKEIEKVIKKKGLDWYQFHGICIGEFVRSGLKKKKFLSFRPDNLKLYTLVGEGKERCKIEVNGRAVNAVKIRVHLAGLWSKIWKAEYWFRETDGLFLRYEAVNGFPGTPKTVYKLIEPEVLTVK